MPTRATIHNKRGGIELRIVLRLALPLLAVTACLITAGSAGAAAPIEGASVPGSAIPVGTHIAGIPFSSGQQINVVIPANSLFIPTTSVNILECAAPDGVLPTLPSECDGNTIQGPTVLPNSDGSINLSADGYGLYTIYALPDSISLGEDASNTVTCGDTAATECVLYIGDNQGDFTQPHVWSQPFYVSTVSDDNGTPVGDGSPPPPPMPPSATLSTVVASPATATADGTSTSTVTVTLVEAGNVPGADKSVTLEGSGHAAISPATAVTDANGVATFSVTDATTETVTLTATDTTDNPPVVLATQPTVEFQAPVVTNANSTVLAGFPGASPGLSTTIAVTLKDQGTPPGGVAGQTVQLTETGSTGSTVTISPPSNVTNSSGIATFSVSDTDSEVVTFTATDVSDSDLVLSDTATVNFGFAGGAVPVGSYTVGAPFASGQNVNIVVPANSVLPADTQVNILECSAPDGVVPTNPAACDGDTIQGPTVLPNSDGSLNLSAEGDGLYTIYALPDSISLGEDASNTVTCGDTEATECVLYIGDDQNDFTKPHVWSGPFFVVANRDDNGEPAGDGSPGNPPAATPEVASIITLPVVAIALIWLVVSAQTRRRRKRLGDLAHPV
jgi:hypothetical protein